MKLREPLPMDNIGYYGYLACVDRDSYLIEGIRMMHFPPDDEPLIVDVTYGTGIMWRDCAFAPDIKLDINPKLPGVTKADFFDLSDVLGDESVDMLVFDPPHLPNRHNTKFRKSGSYMNKYGLETETNVDTRNVTPFFKFYNEAYRVLSWGGIVATKIADLVMESFTEFQQITVISEMLCAGLWPADQGVKYRSGATISSKWKDQRHFRKNMSYWIVGRKERGKYPRDFWTYYPTEKIIAILDERGYDVVRRQDED